MLPTDDSRHNPEPGVSPFYCPNCRGALSPDGAALRCPSCARTFPTLGSVSCLVPDPAFWRALWLSRLTDFEEFVRQHVMRLDAKLKEPALTSLTAQRLSSLRSALSLQSNVISEYLEPLGQRASGPLRSAFQAGMSGHLPIIKCYENLFRDWSWGAAEAAEALDLVLGLAAGQLGTCAVYGAGASRLAVDLHASGRSQRTIALDINPFPLLVAARLVRGDEVTLPEFPVGPASERNVVIMQALRCATRVDERFNLVFGDVLRPPFSEESLDSVITSWVIDAVDADFADTASAIARVLREGGVWLNVGPLRFDRSLAEAYSIEEVLQIAQNSGLRATQNFQKSVAYFNSPHSGSQRHETVFCFGLRKVTKTPAREPASLHPPWLLDLDQPIPLSSRAAALRRSSVLTLGVLSLVDGNRSVSQVAAVLGAQWQTPPETLVDPLRVFFSTQGLT